MESDQQVEVGIYLAIFPPLYIRVDRVSEQGRGCGSSEVISDGGCKYHPSTSPDP